MFWDGTRWVQPEAARPRRRGVGDWVATGAMFVVLALIVVPLSAATAVASPAITVAPTSTVAGVGVTVSGSGFPKNQAGYVALDGASGPAFHANGKGSFAVVMKVPAKTDTGSHQVAAHAVTKSGRQSSSPNDVVVASTTITVTSGQADPPPTPTPTRTPAPTTAPVATPRPTVAPTAPAASTAPPTQTASATSDPGPAATAEPTATAPTATKSPSGARLIFGLGSQIEGARAAPITQQAPIHMLSSWYNGPNDLGWITDAWHRSIYQDAYGAGYALHLITWTDVPETTFSASTGTVCGRAYPLSDQWRDDMRQLARAFAGSAGGPPLYVTLFTEFQTYPCIDSAWSPSAQVTNYYQALIAQYEQGVAIFHQYAPNALVSLGWGGWQTRFDNPSIDAGRSMIPHFAAAMGAGDFVSFQAMAGDSNVSDIQSMTATLGAYGPVMLAHHMPDGDTNSRAVVDATFYADVQTLLTSASISSLAGDGLFAWSFLNDQPMRDSSAVFSFVKSAVTTFGK